MSELKGPGSAGNTDIAALAAGVVAVAVTLVTTNGAWTILGVAVGVSLLLLILGYVWWHPRNLWQSLALGSVVALCSLPLFGFASEGTSWGSDMGDRHSNMLMAGWVLVTALAAWLDRLPKPVWLRPE